MSKPPQNRIKSHIYLANGLINPNEIQQGLWRGYPVTVEPDLLSQAITENRALLVYPQSKMGRVKSLLATKTLKVEANGLFQIYGVWRCQKGRSLVSIWRNKTERGKCQRKPMLKKALQTHPLLWDGVEGQATPQYIQVVCQLNNGVFEVVASLIEPTERLPFRGVLA